MSIKLIIFLHGVGSQGDDLRPVGQFWQHYFPKLEITTPNAPYSFMNSSEAFQWFSIQGVTEENRLQRIEQARAAFDQTIQNILEQYQLQDHLDQVLFCGFSQGTIMALDAVASGRWNVAGVIGFSGRLATPIQSDLAHKPKILLLHGQDDSVIPVTESIHAEQQLRQAGFNIALQTFENLGHSINQTELQQSLSYIRSF
ncbi:alpha/beta hydrolase [Acinetobacter sp. MB5]|uniref:alpha/beta hydrolase n=1 Tax=Acinetobacter sp. MB5 TaxID=2069438 RepID=UPI000DD05A5F|nr:dienelactone hydrolase family protein [Acinetobacter sp. MB5]